MLNQATNIMKALGVKPEQILLVGSIALDLQGMLPNKRVAHDVDFVITTDDETWKHILDFIKCMDQFPMNSCDVDAMFCYDGCFFLEINNIKINLWRSTGEEKNHNGLRDVYSGVLVKPAGEILKKKHEYNRTKDLNDILNICKSFM